MIFSEGRWWYPVEDSMADRPKRGKRVQIYIPADLREQWDATPRYERSATVAKALRAWWGHEADNVAQSVAPPAQDETNAASGSDPRSDRTSTE